MSAERFEELVGEALDRLPPQIVAMLDNVMIQVQDEAEGQPGLLGLYHGIALTERTTDYSFALPDQVTLYRRPLMRVCTDEQELAAQIAVTVVHELGHHVGIDDERLHELGWA